MPGGQYIRTSAIKEKYSKQKKGKLNPNFKHGSYTQQATEKRIQAMLQARQKIINETCQNKEWLFQKYCIEGTPIQKTADQCKVEFETIWDSLRQSGIPRISMVGREYWHKWVDQKKHKKSKQNKDFKRLMKDIQKKTKGNIAIPKIGQHKTLINQ